MLIDINAEILSDLFEERGVAIPSDIISEVSKQFVGHLGAMHEMESYAHVSTNKPCDKCKEHESTIRALENEITIYNKSVKNKIPGATNVYISRGDLLYDTI
jgi:uncharacterized protein Yka (UPF0111/DUF47 family)